MDTMPSITKMTQQQCRENYFAKKAISNSNMSFYEDNFRRFVEYWNFDTPLPKISSNSLTLGSLIDVLLLGDKTEFEDTYIVYKGTLPSPQLCTFTNFLAEDQKAKRPLDYEGAYKKSEIKKKLLKTIVAEFKKDCTEYFNFLISAENKIVISEEILQKAKTIVAEVLNNQKVSDFLTLENKENVYTVINQLIIFDNYTYKREEFDHITCDIPIKAMLDKVILNHVTKEIFFIDVKTTSNPEIFEDSIIKYKYYRQAAFYRWIFKNYYLKQYPEYMDYKINNFLFLVVSTTTPNYHYLYKLSADDEYFATYGGTIKGVKVKGFMEILNEIGWRTLNNKWQFQYELERNMFLTTNIFDKNT